MKLLKAESEVNQHVVGEGFKCYMIRQMMMAMLYTNRLQKTDKDGERTSKTCSTADYY